MTEEFFPSEEGVYQNIFEAWHFPSYSKRYDPNPPPSDEIVRHLEMQFGSSHVWMDGVGFHDDPRRFYASASLPVMESDWPVQEMTKGMFQKLYINGYGLAIGLTIMEASEAKKKRPKLAYIIVEMSEQSIVGWKLKLTGYTGAPVTAAYRGQKKGEYPSPKVLIIPCDRWGAYVPVPVWFEFGVHAYVGRYNESFDVKRLAVNPLYKRLRQFEKEEDLAAEANRRKKQTGEAGTDKKGMTRAPRDALDDGEGAGGPNTVCFKCGRQCVCAVCSNADGRITLIAAPKQKPVASDKPSEPEVEQNVGQNVEENVEKNIGQNVTTMPEGWQEFKPLMESLSLDIVMNWLKDVHGMTAFTAMHNKIQRDHKEKVFASMRVPALDKGGEKRHKGLGPAEDRSQPMITPQPIIMRRKARKIGGLRSDDVPFGWFELSVWFDEFFGATVEKRVEAETDRPRPAGDVPYKPKRVQAGDVDKRTSDRIAQQSHEELESFREEARVLFPMVTIFEMEEGGVLMGFGMAQSVIAVDMRKFLHPPGDGGIPGTETCHLYVVAAHGGTALKGAADMWDKDSVMTCRVFEDFKDPLDLGEIRDFFCKGQIDIFHAYDRLARSRLTSSGRPLHDVLRDIFVDGFLSEIEANNKTYRRCAGNPRCVEDGVVYAVPRKPRKTTGGVIKKDKDGNVMFHDRLDRRTVELKDPPSRFEVHVVPLAFLCPLAFPSDAPSDLGMVGHGPFCPCKVSKDQNPYTVPIFSRWAKGGGSVKMAIFANGLYARNLLPYTGLPICGCFPRWSEVGTFDPYASLSARIDQ
jgi:hypothetical protein